MFDTPLNMIRAFAAVYETGGIRPAARMLGVTHSSVLRFVKELEAHLGIELTERLEGQRGLTFTPSGQALGKAALSSFAELEKAILSIREAQHVRSVTIETTPSVASRWLLPRLASLDASPGRDEVSLLVDQRVRELSQTGADIAIRLGTGPWNGVDSIPLMDDELIPVMSPSYWAKIGEAEDHRSLATCRLLHDRDPNESWSMWKKEFGPAELDVRKGPRFPSADILLAAAEQGLGVALARRSLAEEAIKRGRLIAPFTDQQLSLPQSVWIILPSLKPRRPAVERVIDWLAAQTSFGTAK